MHPEDVAELVAEQVDELRRQLADRPELGEPAVELLPPTEVRIRLTLSLRESVPAGNPMLDIGVPRYNVPLLAPGAYIERPVILRMHCDGFDGKPPTAELLDQHGAPLPGEEWPMAASGGGIIGGYSRYPRPFFCRPGLREFHEHEQHQDQPWDAYREGYTIASIALSLLHDLKLRWVMGR